IVKIKMNNYRIYPNPTTGLLWLINSGVTGNSMISVYDANSRLVRKQYLTFNSDAEPLDLTDLEKGIYFLKLSLNGQVVTNKIVKL
ncbi:MAG: T9SS type A sorting domain-containing protein, partial [Bacteroidales bacterium]|nr:T9SS type A sorting domain-containing protein [Bacteroidales bacterium]